MNDRFIEDLKNRVDIVEVVRKYAELKKAGKNFMCRSPFRNERTPSFSVSQERQFWYDFGASEGGDVISFVEKVENLSFPEAVEHLAQIAGVEMPTFFGESQTSKEEKKDIFTLHKKAAEFFAQQLQENETAKHYLRKRKISDRTMTDWQIGFGGREHDGLTKFLLKEGFSEKLIAESGVSFEREFGDKRMKDRFYDRIIIPIREPRNSEIVAFSGRDIFDRKNTGKYINSPENPVYHKSSTLLGFDRARKVIGDQDFVIMVEGNFDVISAHNCGFCNAVATCGTALTEDHLRILKRQTTHIYLAFDSDAAGKKATLRSTEMILQMGLNPFIVEIEGGKDFDDLAREDPEILKSAVHQAKPALQFLFEKFAQKHLDNSLAGEKKFLDTFFYFLKLTPRPIEVDDFLNQASLKINRPKAILQQEFQNFSAKSNRYHKPKQPTETKTQKFTREESFVGFIMAFWNYFGDKLNDKVLALFAEEAPAALLQKKIAHQTLSDEEHLTLAGWEMYQRNLYDDMVSDEVLRENFNGFVKILKEKKEKTDRKQQALAAIKSQLEKNAAAS